MSAHARFSPSGASRWMNCAGSLRLSEGIPRRSSVFASEGAAAHTLAATCLADGSDAAAHIGTAIVADDLAFVVGSVMAAGVQMFIDLVRGYVRRGYTVASEVRLDLGHLAGGTFGTGDAVLWHAGRGHVAVVDLKYGAGVAVDAVENAQLLSYGSGAVRHCGAQRAALTLAIVQPRTPSPPAVKIWDVPAGRLERFEDDFRAAAAAALRPDAELRAGTWCKFCPAASCCPAKAAQPVALGLAWGPSPF